MSKKIQLSVPKPCHENWNAMTPAEKGKFCGSCQKQVVDFSRMTDREVAMFFKKPATGSVCGRFMEDQLNRELEIPKKRTPWIKYFFTIAIPAFFSMKAMAQGSVRVNRVDTVVNPIKGKAVTMGIIARPIRPEEKPVCKKPVENKIVVNGKVVNEQGESIPFASIRIINNGKTIAADGQGVFKFITQSEEKLVELEVTSVGYNPKQYIYPFAPGLSSVVDITIQLKATPNELPEALVSTHASNYILGSVVNVHSVVGEVDSADTTDEVSIDTIAVKPVDIHSDETELDKVSLKIYPNPGHPGSTIFIELKRSGLGDFQIQLFSQAGQLIIIKEMASNEGQNRWPFELPHIPPGMYILKLTDKKSLKTYSEKIIVL